MSEFNHQKGVISDQATSKSLKGQYNKQNVSKINENSSLEKEGRTLTSNSLKLVFKQRKKHLQLLDKYTKVNYIGQYICTLCQTRHASAKSLEDHRASKGHLNNLNMQNKQQTVKSDPEVRVTDVQHPALDITGILVEVKTEPGVKINHKIKTLNSTRYLLVDFSQKYNSFAIQIPQTDNIIDLQERFADNVNVWLCQLFFGQ